LIDQITRWDKDWATRYPRRVKRTDKELFLDELDQALQTRGFETTRLSLRYLLQNQLLLTQCQNPKVIFTAHYDTPTIMPTWISAFFKVLGHTRQISGSLILFIFLFGFPILVQLIFPGSVIASTAVSLFYLAIILSCLSLFIPNPHNREDNTSGVIGLMALAEWLKDKPELREQVQLVFFDNEELGLLGSNALRQYWNKENHPYRDAAIINLDCISRGRIPLVVHHGNDHVAKQVMPHLSKHLPNAKNFHLRLLPLSDNYTFRDIGAIDISYAVPTIIPGGYYIPKIHSPSDNDFSPERLIPLIQSLTDFLQKQQSSDS
jgi:hypothetical protein